LLRLGHNFPKLQKTNQGLQRCGLLPFFNKQKAPSCGWGRRTDDVKASPIDHQDVTSLTWEMQGFKGLTHQAIFTIIYSQVGETRMQK